MGEDGADEGKAVFYHYHVLKHARESSNQPPTESRRNSCLRASALYAVGAGEEKSLLGKITLEKESESWASEAMRLAYNLRSLENARKMLNILADSTREEGGVRTDSTEEMDEDLNISGEELFKDPQLVAALVSADVPRMTVYSTSEKTRGEPKKGKMEPEVLVRTGTAGKNQPQDHSGGKRKVLKPDLSDEDEDFAKLIRDGVQRAAKEKRTLDVEVKEQDAEAQVETVQAGSTFRSAGSVLKKKPGKFRQGSPHEAPQRRVKGASKNSTFQPPRSLNGPDEEKEKQDLPKIPNVSENLVEVIMNEVMDKDPGVDWNDIAGLEFAKKCVMEAVIWPMMRPDIFTGLRGPPKGLLLFGPPGTGKTMIGKAIASKSGATFFNISASSMTSKWVGEGEKTVRALFAVARLHQPAVIFIDEIDSLLTARTESDQESTRRIKTEFLVQMDGAGTSREDRILVVGATNRPQELDEAARRRLVKRLYIPLPDMLSRNALVSRLLQKQANDLSEEDIKEVANLTEEAALGPVRELGDALSSISADSVRQVNLEDFQHAARLVRASVGATELEAYVEWNNLYGSFAIELDTKKE